MPSVLVLALLVGALATSAHAGPPPGGRWEGVEATPGVRVQLEEVDRTRETLAPTCAAEDASARAAVQYRFRASGLPAGPTYVLWTRRFGDAPERLLTLRVDPAGRLVSAPDGRSLDPIVLEAAHYPRGLRYEVALVSTDDTVRAFAHAVPFPIEAASGACRVSLELRSRDGLGFVATGKGFRPGEPLAAESGPGGRAVRETLQASPDGTFGPVVLRPAPPRGSFSATYTVTGEACTVSVTYEWGPPALHAQ